MLAEGPGPRWCLSRAPGAGALADRSREVGWCILEPQRKPEKFSFTSFFFPLGIFSCLSLPTPLTVPDLWSDLCELVAGHTQGPAEDQKSCWGSGRASAGPGDRHRAGKHREEQESIHLAKKEK